MSVYGGAAPPAYHGAAAVGAVEDPAGCAVMVRDFGSAVEADTDPRQVRPGIRILRLDVAPIDAD